MGLVSQHLNRVTGARLKQRTLVEWGTKGPNTPKWGHRAPPILRPNPMRPSLEMTHEAKPSGVPKGLTSASVAASGGPRERDVLKKKWADKSRNKNKNKNKDNHQLARKLFFFFFFFFFF